MKIILHTGRTRPVPESDDPPPGLADGVVEGSVLVDAEGVGLISGDSEAEPLDDTGGVGLISGDSEAEPLETETLSVV